MKVIMVVDDEKDVRETVSTLLSFKGYDVIQAADADDCLRLLAKRTPHLILMDIMMPGTPVKEVMGQITQVPICFLSVVRTKEAEKMNLLAQPNVVGFIQKPFDVDAFLDRVKKLVGE